MNTQQKIINTAISVFNDDFSATFEEIAIRCSLNRRTLHRYFKNRNELLEACNANMMKAWEEAAIKACNSSTTPPDKTGKLIICRHRQRNKVCFFN